MTKVAHDRIMDGLQDALAFARGDASRGKAQKVAVPTVNVRDARRRLSMSQTAFAATFGVSVATVRNWEQGRRKPEGPARVLLAVIRHSPGAVLAAIGTSDRTPAARRRSA